MAEWDILGDKAEYENWLRRKTGDAPAAHEENNNSDDAATVHESESRVLELPDDVHDVIETDQSLADVLRAAYVAKVLERCAEASDVSSGRFHGISFGVD